MTKILRIETSDIEDNLTKYLEDKIPKLCKRQGWGNDEAAKIRHAMIRSNNGTYSPWFTAMRDLERVSMRSDTDGTLEKLPVSESAQKQDEEDELERQIQEKEAELAAKRKLETTMNPTSPEADDAQAAPPEAEDTSTMHPFTETTKKISERAQTLPAYKPSTPQGDIQFQSFPELHTPRATAMTEPSKQAEDATGSKDQADLVLDHAVETPTGPAIAEEVDAQAASATDKPIDILGEPIEQTEETTDEKGHWFDRFSKAPKSDDVTGPRPEGAEHQVLDLEAMPRGPPKFEDIVALGSSRSTLIDGSGTFTASGTDAI